MATDAPQHEIIEKVPAKMEVVAPADPKPVEGAEPSKEPVKEPVSKTYSQAEVDEITRKVKDNARMKRKELQDEARALRRIALERGVNLNQQHAPHQQHIQQPAQQQEQLPTAPRREQYADDAAYFEAVVDYRADLKVREHTERQTKETAARNARQAQEQLERTFATNQQKAMAKYEDYEEVVYNESLPPLHPVVIQAIKSLENGGDIAYAIAKDRDKAVQLSQMHPILALKELGKIEAMLVAPSAPAGTPAVTPAAATPVAKKPPLPAPLKPVTPKDARPESDDPSDDDDDATWLRKRNKQLREAGKR